MKCNLDKPIACFNCPYPDCIAYNNPTREETAMLNAFIPDRKTHRTDARRKDRKEYYKEYHKAHKKELKKYYADYYKRQKAAEVPDISAWDIWGNGFYVSLDGREEVKGERI